MHVPNCSKWLALPLVYSLALLSQQVELPTVWGAFSVFDMNELRLEYVQLGIALPVCRKGWAKFIACAIAQSLVVLLITGMFLFIQFKCIIGLEMYLKTVQLGQLHNHMCRRII